MTRFSQVLAGLLASTGIIAGLYGAQPIVKMRLEDACGHGNRDLLGDICGVVQSQVKETNGGQNKYYYQTVFQDAAGASIEHDSPEMIRKKIQHFWHLYEPTVTCSNTQFNVPSGSLLKFAVSKSFDAFIREATVTWQLPLNTVDKADDRTVLDYVRDEQERYRGTPLDEKLGKYYRALRKLGAKHKAELKGDGTDDPPDPYEVEIKPLLAVWDKACYFSEDLAAVKKDGKWGYVDRQHQIRIKPEYDGAFSFSEGRAAVVKDGKWGYIDPEGKVVIPLKYADARVFAEGKAQVTTDGKTWVTIDKSGTLAAD